MPIAKSRKIELLIIEISGYDLTLSYCQKVPHFHMISIICNSYDRLGSLKFESVLCLAITHIHTKEFLIIEKKS